MATKNIFVHADHLSSRKLNRFLSFYTIRFNNGQPVKDIVETWNRFQKYPEDTVYVIEKSLDGD